MIACIEGILREKNENSALVMVNGLGYQVFLPARILSRLQSDAPVFFYTFHRLKEDISDLYGFEKRDEKAFFQTLLSISGIGPKTALALTEFPLQTLVTAVENEDVKFLIKTPGLGKKTASRLILELKGKLPKDLDLSKNTKTDTPKITKYKDIITTLESLGFDTKSIQTALDEMPEKIQSQSDEGIVRYCLQLLSSF